MGARFPRNFKQRLYPSRSPCPILRIKSGCSWRASSLRTGDHSGKSYVSMKRPTKPVALSQS